ncbi:MAG: hypothetical protein NZT61_06250 [Deltaproteobacteria bacterium]|nr:hypothetical protein [Deltaproteobacteria bacterium]MCX7952761.1 hypothetical protein [Deltaproteobacteria bacterium]
MKLKRKEFEKKVNKAGVKKNSSSLNPNLQKALKEFFEKFKSKLSNSDLNQADKIDLFVEEFSKWFGDSTDEFKSYLYVLLETNPKILREFE